MERVEEREILSQRSWVLMSGNVEMAVTHLGGQMAPVHFFRNAPQPVQPYYISPWQSEKTSLKPGCSEFTLRGNFFCMPFGQDRDPDAKEKYPPHGETSGLPWSLVGVEEDAGVQTLTIGMELKTMPGSVTRRFSLVQGENVVYDCTTIRGFAGPVTMAHHVVVRSPEQERGLLLSTSCLQFGMVNPYAFGDPALGEYQALEIGAEFATLERVPSIFKHMGDQDCSSYPARRGFSDMLQLANIPDGAAPAWTAAVNTAEGYVWFALKDVRILPSTVVWMENRGRHGAPWNGRNCALGLEEACTFFDRGIPESTRANAFSDRGITTHHELNGDAFDVRFIQGVVKTLLGFGRVVDAVFTGDTVTFIDAAGMQVSTAVQIGFLHGAMLR